MEKRRIKEAFRLEQKGNIELHRKGDYFISDDQDLLKKLEDKNVIEVENTISTGHYESIKNKTIEVQTVDLNNASDETADIKHIGGGWYELPNGEKVQGKDEAIEAIEVLKAE